MDEISSYSNPRIVLAENVPNIYIRNISVNSDPSQFNIFFSPKMGKTVFDMYKGKIFCFKFSLSSAFTFKGTVA